MAELSHNLRSFPTPSSHNHAWMGFWPFSPGWQYLGTTCKQISCTIALVRGSWSDISFVYAWKIWARFSICSFAKVSASSSSISWEMVYQDFVSKYWAILSKVRCCIVSFHTSWNNINFGHTCLFSGLWVVEWISYSPQFLPVILLVLTWTYKHLAIIQM